MKWLFDIPGPSGGNWPGFSAVQDAAHLQRLGHLRVVEVEARDKQRKKKLPDGNTLTNTVTGMYYRDQNGRVRIERGAQISIQDPVAGFSAVLGSNTLTARKLMLPTRSSLVPSVTSASSAPPSAGASGPVASRQAPVDLGTEVVSGYTSSGKLFTTTIPVGAVGNILPIIGTTEVWISSELHLPLMLKTSDPLNGQHTTVYSNVTPGGQLDPSLFIIPANYQVTVSNLNLGAQTPRGLQLIPPAGGAAQAGVSAAQAK